MEYRDEKVMASVNVMYRGLDMEIPDCMYLLILTKTHLYASFDEGNGTYTDYISLNISSIIDITLENPFSNSINEGSSDSIGKGKVGILQKIAQNNKFLLVKFTNINGAEEIYYFLPLGAGSKKFVSEFAKLKED